MIPRPIRPPFEVPGDPKTKGMSTSAETGAPNGTVQGESPTLPGSNGAEPSAKESTWADSAYRPPGSDDNRYAIEARAESVSVLAYGDAVRRGETDCLRTGQSKNFNDSVAGEETAEVEGMLLERIGRGSKLAAKVSELTVQGRLSASAVGWKSQPFSGEDVILLGGALTDTWTGGLMIAAAMSDDLAIGVGARLTAPVDLWLNQLAGIEERPGTAAADGLMVDLCGTLFEREYGAGNHSAFLASFSGTVHQTQRLGFWPLMRVAVGVRNLLPGAGGAASEQAPPTPPAAPAGAGEGILVATNLAGGAAGSLRGTDNLQDMTRVAAAADEMEDVANLRHAENAAVTLDELATTARVAEQPAPNGLEAVELPQASPGATPGEVTQAGLSPEEVALARMLDDYDFADAAAKLDAIIDRKIEQIEQVREAQLDQINDLIARKLAALDEAAVETGADPVPLPAAPGKPFDGFDIPNVPWPGNAVGGPAGPPRSARGGDRRADGDP